jgi:hypothetical protein
MQSVKHEHNKHYLDADDYMDIPEDNVLQPHILLNVMIVNGQRVMLSHELSLKCKLSNTSIFFINGYQMQTYP